MDKLFKKRKINILDFVEYELWLEDLQLKGWKLSEIKSKTHIFIKDISKKVRYCLDYCEDYVDRPSKYYEKVYSDFGWELVYRNKDIFLWKIEYEEERPNAFNNIEEIERRNKEFIKASKPMLAACILLIVITTANYMPRFFVAYDIKNMIFMFAWYMLAMTKVTPIIKNYKYYFKNKDLLDKKI
ncbi:DUF2812 domain-containing protein [Clostridium intestinale]|uniref:DUF2812 domain-containing protein n=1 Tax=Clostridium intestinale TaxID=36845 RepID=A0A7D6VSH3_9CLOT|nr:DUF2812 domain-containing protein [Clostridium intestinale]QLY77972.1 DUF2812 domain-containing protein [Clostridium intestinale]